MRLKWILCMVVTVTAMLSGACKREGEGGGTPDSGPGKVMIYLYEDFPMQRARMLQTELRKYFPDVEISEERLALPQSAYVQSRNRYRGTGLLDDLRERRGDNTAVGLTTKVISTSNELSPHYGVMGISYVGKHVAVSSTTIPRNGKSQTDANFIKLTLHELGHAYGLRHCPDQTCYMVDAEHRMKFPHTTGFCDNCRAFLQSKGVRL